VTDVHLTDVPLSGVTATALAVARVRAHESTRPDGLFVDPYAAAFAAAASPPDRSGESRERAAVRRALAFQVVVRTRFFDDYLLDACAHGCRQVVLLAAGLDTRAFRLDWPAGVRLFELDLPDVQRFKAAVLATGAAAPRCERTVLSGDLRDDWSTTLVAAGFEPNVATAWLAEGLLVYLTADDAAHVLTEVGTVSAPGSRLALERGAGARSLRDRDAANEVTSLWHGGLGSDPVTWLDANGWHARAHDLAEVAASYGRPTAKPTRSGFVTAVRQREGVARIRRSASTTRCGSSEGRVAAPASSRCAVISSR
jgi:methyltransferase (TIGR00027 family)